MGVVIKLIRSITFGFIILFVFKIKSRFAEGEIKFAAPMSQQMTHETITYNHLEDVINWGLQQNKQNAGVPCFIVSVYLNNQLGTESCNEPKSAVFYGFYFSSVTCIAC